MDPLIGLARSFAVALAGEIPGMLQGVAEIQDLATVDEPCGPIPWKIALSQCGRLVAIEVRVMSFRMERMADNPIEGWRQGYFHQIRVDAIRCGVEGA
jgi:hypothetical protein